MKNKFKGFTLIECIVALAILGIASLTMAQIYGGVAKVNKNNNEINTSISNQMKYVEKQIDDGGLIKIKFNNSDDVDPQLKTGDDGTLLASAERKPPHDDSLGYTNGGTTSFLLIEEITDIDEDTGVATLGNEYSCPIDVNILKIRDREDRFKGQDGFDNNYEAVGDTSSSTPAGTGPKYKYFTAH